jgi:proteasome lid subunit RPN8/RPN11
MFTITKRQYDLIMHQAQACYPQESGGILGGREGIILGILPVHNKFLYDRTGTFGMDAGDLERGHEFLAKHKLDYYGIYHSHPKGIPYPSKEDMSHGQKFIFIIGLADRHDPGLYAWQVEHNDVTPVPVKIVDESLVEKMYLSPSKPKLADSAPKDELSRLKNIISDILNGKVEYKKEKPKWDSSHFSTLA